MSVALPIEEDPRFRRYTATAGQTVFSIPFPFQQDEDVSIQQFKDGKYTEVLRSQFSIAGAMDPAGGSVTFKVGRAAGEVIAIVGDAVLDRLSSIVRDGRFASKLTDDELDRNRIIQQEHKRDLKRAIKAPYGSEGVSLEASSPSSLLNIDLEGNIVSSETPANEKTLREAGDLAVASLVGQSGPIEVPFYDTRLAASMAVIKLTVKKILVGGYATAGDSDTAAYIEGDGNSPNGFFSNSGSRGWELSEIHPTAQMFGIFDNGSDGSAGWNRAKAFVQSGKTDRVRFPRRISGDYNLVNVGDLRGVLIDPDPEVIVRSIYMFPYNGTAVTRPMLMRNTGGTAADFWLTPKPDIQFDAEILSEGDVNYSSVRPLDPTQGFAASIAWNAGDTWNDSAPGVSTSSDVVSFALDTVQTQRFTGLFWPAEQATYKAVFTDSGQPSNAFSVIVRAKGHWCMLYGFTNQGTEIRFASKISGQAITDLAIGSLIDAAENISHSIKHGTLGVDIMGKREVRFTVNGIDRTDIFRMQGDIEYVGFATYPVSVNGNVWVHYPTKTTRALPAATRGLRVLIIGDSNTDGNFYPGWPEHFRRILQDSLGVQIEFVNNIGVAGHTAEQQLAILQGMSISGYNMALVMVGTNNGQGQTSYATFENTITNILDRLAGSAGGAFMETVIASPAQFYTRDLAALHGGVGQNSSNYEKVAMYRQIVENVAGRFARNRLPVTFLDTERVLGLVSASYLDWNASGSECDTNVHDNIHLTARAHRKLGRAFAAAAFGVVHRKSEPMYPRAILQSNGVSIAETGEKRVRATITANLDANRRIAVSFHEKFSECYQVFLQDRTSNATATHTMKCDSETATGFSVYVPEGTAGDTKSFSYEAVGR